MRAARIIFVSLLGVGAVGVVYVGLTAGLAAYMQYQADAENPPTAAASSATPTTVAGGPAAESTAAAATPVAANALLAPVRPQAGLLPPPPPGVEDVATLHRRTWTAPRVGLSTPPAFTERPVGGAVMLIASPVQTWTPKAPFPARGRRVLALESAAPALPRPRPMPEPTPVIPALAAAPANLTLPVAPAARLVANDPAVVPVSLTGRRRETERPSPADDCTSAAGEQLLNRTVSPVRNAPAPAAADRLAIPSPAATDAELRTTLDEAAPPGISPDRPTPVKLPTKK
jgi:hypothetical protein